MTGMKAALAAVTVGGVVLSGLSYGQGSAAQQYKEATPSSGASQPRMAATELDLTPAERRLIPANADGSVTREQYLSGMEQRWQMLPKDGSGNVPAKTWDERGDTFESVPLNENPMG